MRAKAEDAIPRRLWMVVLDCGDLWVVNMSVYPSKSKAEECEETQLWPQVQDHSSEVRIVMTPERLEEISVKWDRTRNYGNEWTYADAASEFIPELIESVEQLQARHARNNDIIRNKRVLLDEDDATCIGTHLVKITAENRTLRTENANLLKLLRWCKKWRGLSMSELCDAKTWRQSDETNKTNARELRRILEREESDG